MMQSFTWPQGTDWFLFVELRIVGRTWHRVADARHKKRSRSRAGPTQYSQMLWAILLGYLVFGDHVDLPIILGSLADHHLRADYAFTGENRGVKQPPSVASGPQASLPTRKTMRISNKPAKAFRFYGLENLAVIESISRKVHSGFSVGKCIKTKNEIRWREISHPSANKAGPF